MAKEKIIALYERLSHEDENMGESYSIQNQKKLLEDYCREKGWTKFRHFSDDGISGTTFERPEFKRMMEIVTEGGIETIIIKDMSRLGRDYLVVGQLREIFRQKGVRLIAINDNHDSDRGDDDFLVFRDVMNEMYAKDISKKIRSTFKQKGNAGKHVASICPYGYLKDRDNKDHWIVDEEAAEVVRNIFQWTIDGMGPYQIANKLKEMQIEIPAVHMARYDQGLNRTKPVKDPCGWGSSTIAHILKKREYLGHTVNFKTAKHFKDKKSHYVPENEWVVFENTQEPIITQEMFDQVQKIRGSVRRYPDGFGDFHVLTGLMYCADCGSKMYVHRTSNGKRIPQYTCGAYSKTPVGKLCPTQHRINESVVLELIKETLKAIFDYANYDRQKFIDSLEKAQDQTEDAEIRKAKSRKTIAVNRIDELEKLICRIYEDNILGKLPDARYEVLDKQYSKEKAELEKELFELEDKIKAFDQGKKSANKFIALIEKYEKFDELTNAMILEFVDKILVHEREIKGDPNSPQEIEIYFNFIGQYVPPTMNTELTDEEKEALEKKRKRQEKRHAEYLKRKASGKYDEYYRKYRARQIELITEKKEKIRAEDRANGVYTTRDQLDLEPKIGIAK